MKRRLKPKKQPDDPSREVLHEIYRPGGVVSNLTTFDRKPRRRLRRWIIGIIVFLLFAAAAAIAGLFAFSGGEKEFSGSDVILAFSGAQQAAAEDDYVLKATVTNRGNVELRNVEVSVRFPNGFQFGSSKPRAANDLNNAWSLGSVGAGKEETVQLTGRLSGSVGTDLVFSGSARYEPANFSSEFVAEGTHTVRLTQSALDLTITSPHA
ncbi:MAG: DUF11 domain-containing protein, partial [Candidatus Kerfeldbacteria bacterium]|nr:DUF11 domain-containing protein [Candidatus Kerfeldbacteria bacterium]